MNTEQKFRKLSAINNNITMVVKVIRDGAQLGYVEYDDILDKTIGKAYDEISDLRFSGSVKVDHGLGPQEKDMIDRLSKRLWAAKDEQVAREVKKKMISLHGIPSDIADKIPVTIEPLGFKGNLRYILLNYEKLARQFEDLEKSEEKKREIAARVDADFEELKKEKAGAQYAPKVR